MIETIYINSLSDLSELIFSIDYKAKLDRVRSDCLYRGMPDSSYSLTTSLARNCGDMQAELEPSILRYFAKYAVKEDPEVSVSEWRRMVVGQHYGLPTRLLDWSRSPLVALHFATAENDMSLTDKRDGVIWKINEKELAALLPAKYKKILANTSTDVFSLETLLLAAENAEKYDKDMRSESMAILEPPSSNQRIINQYSYFSVVPMGITDVEEFLDSKTVRTQKYIISRDIRWDARDVLDQLNMSERIMYPNLDGLTKWIARHYYVKDNGVDRGEFYGMCKCADDNLMPCEAEIDSLLEAKIDSLLKGEEAE